MREIRKTPYSDEYATLKAARGRSLDKAFDDIGEFFLSTRELFTKTQNIGEVITNGSVSSSVGVYALRACVSAVVGAMWKGGARSFVVDPVELLDDSTEVREYFDAVTKRLAYFLDLPGTNFLRALNPGVTSATLFGTGVVKFDPQDDLHRPGSFRALPLARTHIDVTAEGVLDRCFNHVKLNKRQVLLKYAPEQLSEQMEGKLKTASPVDTFDFIEVVVRRPQEDMFYYEQSEDEFLPIKGVLGMPVASVTFELDTGHLVEEGGYPVWNLFAARLNVLEGDTYGRGIGFEAMPSMLAHSVACELRTVGLETKADPAKWIASSAVFGSTAINFSPGTLVPIDITALGGAQPVNTIYTVGDVSDMHAIAVDTEKQILAHFYIDRLYDLNAQNEMTLGEADIRAAMRTDGLTPLYLTVESDYITPMLTTYIDHLYSLGLLGFAPDNVEMATRLKAAGLKPIKMPQAVLSAIEAGMDFFRIRYVTPAARQLRAEELRASVDFLTLSQGLAAASPIVRHSLADRKILESFADTTGVPKTYLRSAAEAQGLVDQERDAIAQSSQADTAVKQAQANQMNAQAEATRSGASAQTVNAFTTGGSLGPQQ